MKSKKCRDCCRCCESSSDCCCIKTPHVCTKVVQIILVILDLVVTEVGLFFLACLNIEWRRGEFPNIDLHRIVLWCSLVTTSAILILTRKGRRGGLGNQREMVCPVCGGYEEMDSMYKVQKEHGWSWDYGDYIHSLVTATGFMLCSLSSIIDIPKFYEHHVEVDIKIVGFLLDLLLSLLYTKSCMSAYGRYQGPHACRCENITWSKNSSTPPSSGDETSDDDSKKSLLNIQSKRTRSNKTYSKFNGL
nr:uncharacterized protein LOC100175247 [Ciona intestinalis]|eukprot:XP_026693032.1 uncharacterized protein LOC100175247 [Ciona intestinalis]